MNKNKHIEKERILKWDPVFIPIMLPNDAHYNPNYILMLKSNASIHHWKCWQLTNLIITKNLTGLKTLWAYLSGESSWVPPWAKMEDKMKIPTHRKRKSKKKTQPIESTISIYSLLINGFLVTFFVVVANRVLLFKEIINIEKEGTKEESKTFLSHFDKLA